MNKIYLIKKQELFQGEKKLKKEKNYFEGWYFKNTKNKENIAFIPGINIENKNKNAFIQIITNKKSYYIKYNIKDFKYSHNPFYIKIKNNYFSKNKIIIDIKEKDLKVKGKIKYTDNINIKTNIINPNIMGPFSYIPNMECNHAIISMKNKINGFIKINAKKIIFKNGIGYIEKDWGTSFPRTYTWLQANNFKNEKTSFMLSIANIPFKIFTFKGLICILIIKNKEYKFTTYNNSKIKKYKIKNNNLEIILKRKKYLLIIKTKINKGNKLHAPIKGAMKKIVKENISGKIEIILKENEKILFKDISKNSGIEIKA